MTMRTVCIWLTGFLTAMLASCSMLGGLFGPGSTVRTAIEDRITDELRRSAPTVLILIDTNHDGHVSIDELRSVNLSDPQVQLALLRIALEELAKSK